MPVLTEGVTVRSMKRLFELVLQLEPPWRVVGSDLDFERRRVHLRLGFRAVRDFLARNAAAPARQRSSSRVPGTSRT
jgi:hypothetical protein